MTLHEFVKYIVEKGVPGKEIISMAMLKPGFRDKYPEPEDVPVEEWDKLIEEYKNQEGKEEI